MSKLWARPSRVHLIQLIHGFNSLISIVWAGILIGAATKINLFTTTAAALSGLGNYSGFAYPATFVYMLVPAVCSVVLSLILAFDPSPGYTFWKPSKTLTVTIGCFGIASLMSALLPLVPGADVITTPDSALDCTWTNYMTWKVIFGNIGAFPWVSAMDTACSCFHAADIFAWIIGFVWLGLTGLYCYRIRTAINYVSNSGKTEAPFDSKSTAWPMATLTSPTNDSTKYEVPDKY
ncbi:hypothetical protein J3Q64DRAFT_1847305 [Phycomyces blakesleeanus]|uniref:MARVEL domain-containing protein n=2 Tax=Phycomyces blakesleeanus TaxID=4837 RepID=A0A163AVM1_PHYB8|nr:hypothetical protein PHYBLDRAFT_59642 [Phycomyces blakesleeanus NRRL 1555(-)]OAD76111.1 hypothetical protein PHYBLDRAFT_59642 [Phycomyces blakesleeanus NRRL 1555(-)]|eukprot:XP_018294151.1 hypothetical protein PHYBLDRAFT_59642 [Phycomyces blakesleeanus NRRL 1555(-)]